MSAPQDALYSGPFDRTSLDWFEGAADAALTPEDEEHARDIADLIRDRIEGSESEGSSRQAVHKAA